MLGMSTPENQLDALHPSVTHQSTGIAAGRVEKRVKAEQGAAGVVRQPDGGDAGD